MKEDLRCGYCHCKVEKDWDHCPMCGTNLDEGNVIDKNIIKTKKIKEDTNGI